MTHTHIALAAGSLPFIAVLVYLKLRAQREQQKQNSAMLRHLKQACPAEFGQ